MDLKKIDNRIIFLLFILFLVVVLIFSNRQNIYKRFSMGVSQIRREAKEFVSVLSGIGKEIAKKFQDFLFQPLRNSNPVSENQGSEGGTEQIKNGSLQEKELPDSEVLEKTPESFLTPSGIIYWTNIQREQNQLPSLKTNAKLNSSAAKKLEDMFENQYFAHISPEGLVVEDLAEQFFYEFIVIGENLFFGDVGDDETLVQEWMDSSEHRKNILNPYYEEIGVAVRKGSFHGKQIWMAVQHFAMPFSSCPEIDETLRIRIERNENELSEIKNNLDTLLAEIEAMEPKEGQEYNQKVIQYNALVSQYNILAEENENLVLEYNSQVQAFNECIERVK